MLELFLNCHSVAPVASSRATTSPVALPENNNPPPVASIPAALGRSVSGISHFFSPVTGLIARKKPTTSPGLIGGGRPTTPVDSAPSPCGFGGARFWRRGKFQEVV